MKRKGGETGMGSGKMSDGWATDEEYGSTE
jgi:hypothetical protein